MDKRKSTKKTSAGTDTVPLTVYLSRELFDRLCERAESESRARAQMARRLIEQGLGAAVGAGSK